MRWPSAAVLPPTAFAHVCIVAGDTYAPASTSDLIAKISGQTN
jgi:hypothetical protein